MRASDETPDGRQAVLAIGDGDGVDLHVTTSSGLVRLTAHGGYAQPVWTADGRRIAYASRAGRGAFNLFIRPPVPDAAETRLTTSALPQLPSQVSSDGSTLVFTQADTHRAWTSGSYLSTAAPGPRRSFAHRAIKREGPCQRTGDGSRTFRPRG